MVLWVSLQFVIVIFPDHANLLLHVNGTRKTADFAYKYSKGLDVAICASVHSHHKVLGVQWFSG